MALVAIWQGLSWQSPALGRINHAYSVSPFSAEASAEVPPKAGFESVLGSQFERPGFSRPFCLDRYAKGRFNGYFPLEIIGVLIIERGNKTLTNDDGGS